MAPPADNITKRLGKTFSLCARAPITLTSRLSENLRKLLDKVRYQRRCRPINLAMVDLQVSRQNNLVKPDFIIIGAPKCGTSWLQRALAQHPQILLVPNEIEYFSMHLDYPLGWYLDHFARRLKAAPSTSGTIPILGEKSARYCAIGPDRIRLFHRLLPDVKLVLMTRDPVARHWSQAKRHFSKRRINKREGGVLAIPREQLFDYFENMRPLGEFTKMITNWLEVYRSEQLLLVSQEGTLVSPREAYDAVLAHIGASREYNPAAIKLLHAKTNLGPEVNMPSDVADYLVHMFAPEQDRLRELYGDRASVYTKA